MGAWTNLFLAAILEILWMFCMKIIGKYDLFKIPWKVFIDPQMKALNVLPLVGYIVTGILNVYFLTNAAKYLPASTAYGVWMGTALIGAKFLDIYYFKEPSNTWQLMSLIIVAIGIVGLRMSENQVS